LCILILAKDFQLTAGLICSPPTKRRMIEEGLLDKDGKKIEEKESKKQKIDVSEEVPVRTPKETIRTTRSLDHSSHFCVYNCGQ
jgi:hypothetical protein